MYVWSPYLNLSYQKICQIGEHEPLKVWIIFLTIGVQWKYALISVFVCGMASYGLKSSSETTK